MNMNGIDGDRHVNIFIGSAAKAGQYKMADRNETGRLKGGSVFAGDLTRPVHARIQNKVDAARKQALKLVNDQFDKDMEADDALHSLVKNQEVLKEKELAAHKEVEQIQATRSEYAESYGIDTASDEYKDYELLRKQLLSPTSLTDEEKEKIDAMGAKTDFQEKMLEFDAAAMDHTQREANAKSMQELQGDAIYNINQALAQSAPMVDEQLNADKIMENASKEIISMIQGDAIAQWDEKVAAEKAEAEKKAKEEEEKKAQTEEPSTDVEKEMADQEKLLETTNELEQQVENIIKKGGLTWEDVKGLSIDELS